MISRLRLIGAGRRVGLIAGPLLVAAGLWLSATPLAAKDTADPPQASCRTTIAIIDSGFPGARVNGCRADADRRVRVIIAPEDPPPINPSPWYAFRVLPLAAGTLTVDLSYTHAKHRYWPKRSVDGHSWHRLPQEAVELADGTDGPVRLTLPLDGKPFFIAGQELVTNADHERWMDRMAALPFAGKALLGRSVEDRPIHKLEAAAAGPTARWVVIVGRQHPPEVPGALALMAFVQTLLDDTALARAFRARVNILVVPNLNPDGVVHGHWRHNARGTDLNRDWGPFEQPETRLMQAELARLTAGGAGGLALFLDFHATRRNLFYTQPDEAVTDPPDFTRRWLAAAGPRLDGYAFTREPTKIEGRATAMRYVHNRWATPTVTYEVGDETDRLAIDHSAMVLAQEAMRVLLDDGGPVPPTPSARQTTR